MKLSKIYKDNYLRITIYKLKNEKLKAYQLDKIYLVGKLKVFDLKEKYQ